MKLIVKDPSGALVPGFGQRAKGESWNDDEMPKSMIAHLARTCPNKFILDTEEARKPRKKTEVKSDDV